MSNTLINSTFITQEAVRLLHANCVTIKSISHNFEKYFGKSQGSIGKGGATIYVRKPVLGTVRETWNMDVGDVTETNLPITIDIVRGVDLAFTEADRVLKMDDFSETHIKPNVLKLASVIDAYAANYMKNYIFNVSPTTIGTAPNAISYYLTASRMIKEQLAPQDSKLSCIISPRSEASMVSALAGQYNPSQNISEMYEKGQMAKAAGFDWYMSQNMPSHTHGTCTTGTSPAVSGYAQNTLTISGVTSGGTLKAGDSFYLSIYPVNFETKASYSEGQRVVCTADTTASGTNITVSVKPDLIISGPNQTISATPVGATVTFHQTTASQVCQNDLIVHKDSFGIAFADLEMPKGMDMASSYSYDGIKVRFVRGFDINSSQMKSRLDVFFGIAPLRNEWAGRVIS